MGYKRKRGPNVYQLQVYKGRCPDTGKKQYYYETFHGTDRQADQRMKEIEVDINRKDFVEPSKLSLYEFIKSEFLPHVKINSKTSTHNSYVGILKNHLKDNSLGRTMLTDVGVRHVERYKQQKLATNLAPKTVKNHIILIKAAYSYACRLGMFAVNPIKHASYPKVPIYRPTVFTKKQAAQFIRAAENNEYYLFFLLAIFTGLRLGEMRGLTWPALDLDNCRLTVLQTVGGEGRKAIYGEPKTEGSVASVTFDPSFVTLFEDQRKRQLMDMEKCLRLGITYDNRHLVFATYSGNPLRIQTIHTNLQRITKHARLPRIRFHDLRHTCATLLIASGVHLKTVQARLRHSDIRTTGNIYSHVVDSMQDEANAQMAKVLNLKRERQKERQKGK